MFRKTKKGLNYFDAFNKQADYLMSEADLLIGIVNNYKGPESAREKFDEAHEIENAADEMVHVLLEAVENDFVTPIDRDDIISVATLLDDVVDTLEDVVRHFHMYKVHEIESFGTEMILKLYDECDALAKATHCFHTFKKSTELKEHVRSARQCEEDIDMLYAKAIYQLFNHDCDDVLHLLKWKSLYEKIEECSDNGEKVAVAMMSAALKNA